MSEAWNNKKEESGFLSKAGNFFFHPFLRMPWVNWLFIGLYILILSFFCWQQYSHFIYGGYDLAIFDQVVWNSAHGRWFEYSFSTHSYLVDHRSFLLVLLVPLYWVVAHPMTLLVVQTIGLATGAVFIYHLAQKILKDCGSAQQVGTIAVILYLIQPTLLSMNLFEFHMLPFIIPLALALWLAVEHQRWIAVVVLFIVILLLREDTALMTAGVGLLIIITQWKQRSRLTMGVGAMIVVISCIWFGAMMYVGTIFAPEGVAKFFFMYEWMGSSPFEAVQFMIIHPLRTLAVFGDHDHIIVILFLLATVAFLPLFRVRYLLPAIPQLILFLLVDQQMLWPILKSHYSAVILPWLLIAGLYGYQNLHHQVKGQIKNRKFLEQSGAQGALVVFIVVLIFAQSAVIGPISGLRHYFDLKSGRDLDAYRTVVEMVEPDDVVIASSHIYAHLTEREKAYPDMHIFTGKVHFTDLEYPLPEDVDWIILEQEMILRWGIYLPYLDRGEAGERFKTIIQENELVPVFANEDLVVFGSALEGGAVVDLISQDVERPLMNTVDIVVNHTLHFDSWEYQETDKTHGQLQLLFDRTTKQDVYKDDQHMQLTWRDHDGAIVKEKIFALGFGLEPTHTWQSGKENRRIIHLNIEQPEQAASVELSIGVLDKKFGPFFSLWVADPIMHKEHQVTIQLPGVAPLDSNSIGVAYSSMPSSD